MSGWFQRWYTACPGCGTEAQCNGYYDLPTGWLRLRYKGGAACPDCAPAAQAAEAAADAHNNAARLATRATYAPCYAKQEAWDKANPKPDLPASLVRGGSTQERYVRRTVCPGCGCVDERERSIGTFPSRPDSWSWAGRRRDTGPLICPKCRAGEAVLAYHAAQDAWKAKRDAEIGDVFREARENTIKSVSAAYPEGWKL